MIGSYKSQGSALGIAELLEGIESRRVESRESRVDTPIIPKTNQDKLTHHVLGLILCAPCTTRIKSYNHNLAIAASTLSTDRAVLTPIQVVDRDSGSVV